MLDNSDLAERFKHHPPTPLRVEQHQEVRQGHIELAQNMNDLLPESREKSLCLTALQEAAMWANAALAIHGERAV